MCNPVAEYYHACARGVYRLVGHDMAVAENEIIDLARMLGVVPAAVGQQGVGGGVKDRFLIFLEVS